jgi:alpha-tubulin suppressor-like RCC1 family protein
MSPGDQAVGRARGAAIVLVVLAVACTKFQKPSSDGGAGAGGGAGRGGAGGGGGSAPDGRDANDEVSGDAPDGGGGAGGGAPRPIALTGSFRGTCALFDDGSVRCWGIVADFTGTTLASSARPSVVPGLSGIKSLVAGYYHYCAVDGSGAVWCWGDEVADGPTVTNEVLPKRITHVTSVSALATGIQHYCALLPAATIDCWPGTNGAATLTGVTRIAAGGFEACAIATDTSFTCWNFQDSTPMPMRLLTNVHDLAISEGSYCALQGATDVTCWTQGTTSPPMMMSLAALGHANRLVAGPNAVCALLSDGYVACWGSIVFSAAGGGLNDFSSATPAAIDGAAGVADVAVGREHVCILRASDSSVLCRGANSQGEVGDGTFNPRAAFVPVNW